jgi:hypothetical protein
LENSPEITIEASVVMIWKNKQMTNLMQAVGMFESFKIAGKVEDYTITITTDQPKMFKETLILRLLASFDRRVDETLVMAHVVSIQMDNHIIKNDKYPPFIAGGVTVVSDGSKWFMLCNYIDSLIEGTKIRYEKNEFNQPLKPAIFKYLK